MMFIQQDKYFYFFKISALISDGIFSLAYRKINRVKLILFLFPDGLNIYNTLIIEGVTLFLITLLIIALYKKVGSYASIKSQIGLTAFKIAIFINKRKKLNNQTTGKSPR